MSAPEYLAVKFTSQTKPRGEQIRSPGITAGPSVDLCAFGLDHQLTEKRFIDGISTERIFQSYTYSKHSETDLRPYTVTTGNWLSPELKIFLLMKANRPALGRRHHQLREISRAEPDPTLFQLPSGVILDPTLQ